MSSDEQCRIIASDEQWRIIAIDGCTRDIFIDSDSINDMEYLIKMMREFCPMTGNQNGEMRVRRFKVTPRE